MAHRGRRGGAAALFAARMTEEITPSAEELDALGEAPDEADPAEDEGRDQVEIEDGNEPEPEPSIDYSHEEQTEDAGEDEEEPAPPVDAIADLKAQIDALKAEKDAERRAREDDDEAAELRRHQTAVATGLRRAQNELNGAKADYAKAAAAGNWTEAADAQARIAAATTDIRDFEAAADEVGAAVEAFNKGARRKAAAEPERAPAGDPFEASISKMSDASKEWCRKNKADLTKSPVRAQKAMIAHAEAVESGIKPDTPEYFTFLDKQMGYATVTKKPKPTGRPVVGAPSGGGRVPPRGGAVEVKLSRAEVEMAKEMGMSVKDYAAQKREIIKNGQDRSRGGPVYSQHSVAARR